MTNTDCLKYRIACESRGNPYFSCKHKYVDCSDADKEDVIKILTGLQGLFQKTVLLIINSFSPFLQVILNGFLFHAIKILSKL